MSRFSRRRAGRRIDWTGTPTVRPGDRLSQGSVIRASVLARLLGIRLLKLEADIALVPASFGAVDPAPARIGTVVTGDLGTAAALLTRASRTLEATEGSDASWRVRRADLRSDGTSGRL
jgi:hypothetical protein